MWEAVKMKEHEILMEITDLKKYYPVTEGIFKKVKGYVKAVDNISLSVMKGETLGIVGESGCGKTTLGKCIVRLQKPTDGKLYFKFEEGMKDILSLDKDESFKTRRKIQMVFQDPFSSLNPKINIINAFDEPLRIHGIGDRRARKEIIANMLAAVNLQPDYMYRYPHEFSGGQRQRICIAKALSLNPELIICDEPVSALDVSIQAQVLNLMKSLQKKFNLTYVFIAHDLSVVEYMSNKVAVMYLGRVVEMADAKSLYSKSVHPYTEALLSAVPIPVIGAKKNRIILKGDVPSPVNLPSGCKFHPRCPKCMDICKEVEPELKPIKGSPQHQAACHLASY
jgi:oligopeptide/dipeptide ABC transporter ATP-binding protein